MFQTKSKKLIALFLVVMMLFSIMPMAAFAEEDGNQETESVLPMEGGTTTPPAITVTDDDEDSDKNENNENAENEEENSESSVIDVDAMTDAELLAYYANLSDEEVDDFALSLTEEQLNRLADLLQGVELCAESSETHTVFKNTALTLAPGVTQNVKYAYSVDGKQMVYYIATADVTRNDVMVQTSYKDQYTAKEFGMQKLTDQIAYANKLYTDKNSDRYISDYYNVVAGVNASFYNMTTGQPSGITYLDGVQIGESSSYAQFFAMTKDGKAIIDYTKNLSKYTDNIDQAVAGSVMLVWEGKDVTASASGSYNTDRHSRTCVGVTADGKVVVMVLDGRQEPFSCGGTMHELAQIMLEAGCVAAINLDGGGSTTYVSKAEGANEVSLVNRPSDGSERTISSGLIIASLTVPSDTFDHVSMTVTDEYVTPGTSTTVKVAGVSVAGSAAIIPDGITYEVTNGTYVNGVLTATAVGDVILTAKYNSTNVGSVTVHAVEPTAISFSLAKMVLTYGKTVSFNIKATVNNGLNDVKFKESDIALTISDAKLGSLNGLSYTTVEKADGVTSGTITAKLVSNTAVSATINIELTNLPDTPVVWETFEDKPYYRFSNRYADVYKYEIVDSTTGHVHSGNYALAVTMQIEDFGLNQYSGFVQFGAPTDLSGYGAVTGTKTFESLDLTNAKKLGMWVYVPEDSQTSYIQFRLRNKNNYDDQLQYRLYDYGYSTTEMGHRGWRYFELNFDEVNTSSIQYNDGSYYLERIDLYSCTRNDAYNKSEYGYDVYDQQSIKGAMTFYFDDLTVEYVDTGADFVDPVFDYVRASYGGASDSVALNGQTITTNVISVTARASDAGVGIDPKSAKAYIDGVELTSGFRCDELGIMTIDDVTLADGTHTFTFVISDKNGNCEYVTRQVTINAKSGIPTAELVLAEELTSKPLFGQVVWFNLNVDDIEKVDTVSTILNLNATSNWELDHMVVANGFEASYTIDATTNDATITIKKVGKTSLSGKDTLVQIPVRMHYVSNLKGYSSSMVQPEDIKLSMDMGLVSYQGGTSSTFSVTKFDIDSERYNWYDVMNNKGDIVSGYMMHTHTAKAIADKAATCSESGYTGRTYCEVCRSVVDWGTTVKATGHSYAFDTDGVLKCSCGDLFTGKWNDGKEYKDGKLATDGWQGDYYYRDGVKLTGVQKVTAPDSTDEFYYNFGEDGKSQGKYTGLFYDTESSVYRYSQLGKLSSGWKQIDDDWYYFRESTQAAPQKGYVYWSGIPYQFEENGKLISGVWVTTEDGTRYYYASSSYYRTVNTATVAFYTIDGKVYGFDRNGYIYKDGVYGLGESNQKELVYYAFDENGVRTSVIDFYNYSGIIKTTSGSMHYYVNGTAKQMGLIKIGDYFYYIRSGGVVATGSYYCTYNMTDQIPIGTYTFDSNGRMQNVPTGEKNGIVNENGTLYYYVDGVKQLNLGLIAIEDNGEKCYIYVRTAGQLAVGKYKVWINNDIVPYASEQDFGTDGKMKNAPTVGEKNGIVNENGMLYYYVDGVKQLNLGLIAIEDNGEQCYIYVRTAGQLAVGKYKVWINNDVVPYASEQDFGTDGKMKNAPTVGKKNGIVNENGTLYYYVDGVKQLNLGLIAIEDNGEQCYIYIRTAGQLAVGKYKVWINNKIVPYASEQDFGTDGKMIVNRTSINLISEITNTSGSVYHFE